MCPNKGLHAGCGAGLNHFTAMTWKDATHIGCAAVARQTPLGPFMVIDCRYASNKAFTLHHCNIPNTMHCDGAEHPEDGNQVPALVGPTCPKAESVPWEPRTVAEGALATTDCIQKGSLGKCDKCIVS